MTHISANITVLEPYFGSVDSMDRPYTFPTWIYFNVTHRNKIVINHVSRAASSSSFSNTKRLPPSAPRVCLFKIEGFDWTDSTSGLYGAANQ